MTDPRSAQRKWPTLPVFGWAAFSGAKRSDVPCILDAPNVAFTSSGRAAIALALDNLGIGAGDSVLVPTYHCPTMVAPVAASGATPMFFPIDDDGSPALGTIAAWDLSRVRAMSVVHYFGFLRPMAQVRQFCEQRGISLIEDCAHAMFGRSDEGDVGTFGDYAIGSLTKFFPVVDGGCLVSHARPISAEALRPRGVTDQMRSAANTIEIGASHRAMPGVDRVIEAMFTAANALRGVRRNAQQSNGAGANGVHAGGNGTTPPFESAARASAWAHWVAQTAGRARIVALRRRNYEHMAGLLARVPGTRVLFPALPDGVVPYVFPLWVEAPYDVYPRMRAAGIPLFRWDDVWPGVPALANDVGADWSIRVFQIACHQDLSLADLEAIADSVKQILADARS
jgi:hypothetical protein